MKENNTSGLVQGSQGKWTGSKNYSRPFGAPGTFQHHFPRFIFNPMQQTSANILPVFSHFIYLLRKALLECTHICANFGRFDSYLTHIGIRKFTQLKFTPN